MNDDVAMTVAKPVLTVAEASRQLTAPGAPFETAEAVIEGRRVRVWSGAPPTLRHVLEKSLDFAKRPYLVYGRTRLSYADHYAKVQRLAWALVNRFGVAKGDRVVIVMRNYPEWPIAFWATVCVGAIAVPLNAWWSKNELAYGLEDCGAKVLIADKERLVRLAARSLHLDGVIAVRAKKGLPDAARSFEEVVSMVPAGAGFPDVAIDPDDDATIFYTSGTTGRPKGALGTHRNICTNHLSVRFAEARTAIRYGRPIPVPGADEPPRATLLAVPFFHVTGCHSVLMSTTMTGGKLVMMRKWDAERALRLIERERITAFGGVPAIVWQVIESQAFADTDTSSVQTVAYGGAPAATELVRRIRHAFPDAQPRNGYGLTETSSVTAVNGAEDYLARPESCGPAVAVCDVRCVGADGADVGVGESGELWVRGPNVIKGYWNDAAATDEVLVDGWVRTGDIVRIDAEGFITVVDRAKDVLIRGGENIYCIEVEDALYSHADVLDAAVVGIPHRILGEEVGAFVQVAPNSAASEADLQAHVAERLAAFKVPVRIFLRTDPLPRNANGKIVKSTLKAAI